MKTSEPVNLKMKKLADQASKLLKEYRLNAEQKAQCNEIIRAYEKYRATQTLLEFKK